MALHIILGCFVSENIPLYSWNKNFIGENIPIPFVSHMWNDT